MPRGSQYSQDSNPLTTDNLLGVQSVGPATKRFSISSLITLFYNNIPAGIIKPTLINNPYKFSVYRSSNQSLASGASKMLLDTKLYDTGSNFDNATNYRFTAPVSGFYHFDGSVLATTNTGVYLTAVLYKNGSTFVQGNANRQDTGGAATTGSLVSETLSLAANDYIELWVSTVTQTNATVLGGAGPILTKLTGFLVSGT